MVQDGFGMGSFGWGEVECFKICTNPRMDFTCNICGETVLQGSMAKCPPLVALRWSIGGPLGSEADGLGSDS